MTEILSAIGGTILGVLLTIIYEKFKERKSRAVVRRLLVKEIEDNMWDLNQILSILKAFSGPDLPSYYKTFNCGRNCKQSEKSR